MIETYKIVNKLYDERIAPGFIQSSVGSLCPRSRYVRIHAVRKRRRLNGKTFYHCCRRDFEKIEVKKTFYTMHLPGVFNVNRFTVC